MHWTIAAPWIDATNQATSRWIHDYVDTSAHEFEVIPRPSPMEDWHKQKSQLTSKAEWLVHWRHANQSIQQTRGGVITVFPQLAAAVALQKRVRRTPFPILAYLFNVGLVPGGWKRQVARQALTSIDRFVVHTTREQRLYSEWLGMPRERFEFVPLQSGEILCSDEEDTSEPFVLAMGSAHRDYPNFFRAIGKLGFKTIVIAAPRVMEGLDVPKNVEVVSGLTMQECFGYARRARLNVTPLMPNEQVTATGQVTIVNTMSLGKTLISSDCNGVRDYMSHDDTGWLIEPRSADAIADAIDLLWHDDALRNRLNARAKAYADDNFSDRSAGRNLTRILDQLAAEGRG